MRDSMPAYLMSSVQPQNLSRTAFHPHLPRRSNVQRNLFDIRDRAVAENLVVKHVHV